MERIRGGVLAPRGFLASGVRAGIKKWARDLGLLYSEIPATAAAVFTTNRVQAAPVLVSRQHLKGGRLQAVIVNSGNANCCTGGRGLRDARRMASLTAETLRIPGRTVAVCSTGVIGSFLPIDRVERKIPILVSDLSRKAHLEFAEAILTTDKKIKEVAVRFRLGKGSATIGAVCKGAGMIHPQMATMLCFITTDVAIKRRLLQSLLAQINEQTFNRLTIDGDRSTNDTVLVLANGSCGNRTIDSATSPSFKVFEKALACVMGDLAKKVVADGEGATRVAEVVVTHARSEEEALRGCKAVANSNLVKTALFGHDPNWGRIAASVGASGVSFNPAHLSIAMGSVWFFRRGHPVKPGRALRDIFKQDPVQIRVDLGAGAHEASVLTCDLTDEYVRINAHYHT